MPNHFHALLTPGEQSTLEKAMQMIKGGSAYEIGKRLGCRLPVWQSGFHDRWIRNAEEYASRKRYIELNPVTAKLVDEGQEYRFSSANGNFRLDRSQFG